MYLLLNYLEDIVINIGKNTNLINTNLSTWVNSCSSKWLIRTVSSWFWELSSRPRRCTLFGKSSIRVGRKLLLIIWSRDGSSTGWWRSSGRLLLIIVVDHYGILDSTALFWKRQNVKNHIHKMLLFIVMVNKQLTINFVEIFSYNNFFLICKRR